MTTLTVGNSLRPEFDMAKFDALVHLALDNLSEAELRARTRAAVRRPGLWVVPSTWWLRVDWPEGWYLVSIYRSLLLS